MKAKNIIYIICSIIVVVILGIMAYIGLGASLIPSLSMPDFILNFDVFYQVFYSFGLDTFAVALPLFIGAVFAMTQFAEKNWKLVLLILEFVFLIIIFLHGFNVF